MQLMIGSFFSNSTSDEQLLSQRRNFLKMGLVGIVGAAVPLISARSVVAANNSSTWKVSFRNSHTDESFSGVYRVGDKYLPEAFERINYVLRDFRTQEVFPMDPHMIDLISIMHRKMDAKDPYQILSAYRSPKTNAMLGSKYGRVAQNSFHMYGQAIDVRIPDSSTKQLRSTAMSLKAGGVGYYSRSGFVHVDTGDVRSWSS